MERMLRREQLVRRPIEEVFAFFADAHNLERITPTFLNFHIESMDTPEVREGTHIRYKLSLHGLPMGWTSRIDVWDPPHRFVDLQIKGPYKLWHHTHTFESVAEGTMVRDEVRYELPFGFLGDLVHGFVERDLKMIFDYRRKEIERYFA